MKKRLQHEDSTLSFNWVLADDGGGTVIASWRDVDNRMTSRKLVVDDIEQLPESIADIIHPDQRQDRNRGVTAEALVERLRTEVARTGSRP